MCCALCDSPMNFKDPFGLETSDAQAAMDVSKLPYEVQKAMSNTSVENDLLADKVKSSVSTVLGALSTGTESLGNFKVSEALEIKQTYSPGYFQFDTHDFSSKMFKAGGDIKDAGEQLAKVSTALVVLDTTIRLIDPVITLVSEKHFRPIIKEAAIITAEVGGGIFGAAVGAGGGALLTAGTLGGGSVLIPALTAGGAMAGSQWAGAAASSVFSLVGWDDL